jgi:hypothetical protein
MRTEVLTLLLVCLLAAPAIAASPVTLEAVTVHVFLETSGHLSADVTSMRFFETRNGMALGSDLPDEEMYDSFLVKLAFSAPRETFQPGSIATVRITAKKTGRIVLVRTIRDLYVGPAGRTHIPIFVAGRQCEPVAIEVRSAARTIRKEVEFTCGE